MSSDHYMQFTNPYPKEGKEKKEGEKRKEGKKKRGGRTRERKEGKGREGEGREKMQNVNQFLRSRGQ